VVEYVFRYPDLNRLPEADLMGLMRGSGLQPVLVIRRQSPFPAPAGTVATRTRELLWVLKKGPPSALEKATTLLRFAAGFARTRLGGRGGGS
jgi:hypothetical protein